MARNQGDSAVLPKQMARPPWKGARPKDIAWALMPRCEYPSYALSDGVVADGGLLLRDVCQRDGVQVLVDHFVQPFPKAQRRADVPARTAVGVVVQAGHRGERTFQRADDLTGGLFGGGAGELVAAGRAPA